MALLPGNVGIGILVILAPGLLWLCGKRRSSRKPWTWFLLFLCLVVGFAGMSGYRKDGVEKEALWLTEGKRVWVRGIVEEIGEKEKSYGLTLSGCRVMGTGTGGLGGKRLEKTGDRSENGVEGSGDWDAPDMVVYVEKEKFERVEESLTVRLGMEVAMWGEIKEPSEARNPGEFDFKEYYRALGIRLQMFGEDMKVVDGPRKEGWKEPGWRYRDWLYRMRLAAGEVLESICEPEDYGIFQAAILGDKTALDDGVRRLYQRNGIAHLLAISGLHISLVGMCVYRGLRRAGMSYGAAGIIGAAAIVSYGILTGGSSSVMRAVCMLLVFLLAGYLGRSYDMLSAAGLACILILLEYPGLVTQAGFQLSFGAVAAIGGLGPWMVEKLEIKNSFGKTVVLGAAVQMVTCPVIVYHFYEYPIYGIVLNLVVIPLMGYVVVSGILGIALGAVWRPAGVVAVGSGHYILEFYRWLCSCVERLPGANLIVGQPRLWQIGVYIAAMAVLLWYVCCVLVQRYGQEQGQKCGQKREQKHGIAEDNAGSHISIRRMIPYTLLAIGTVLCFFLLWQLPTKGLEVTFLDVGQGDGICIRSKGAVILVDGGSTDKKELGKNTMEPYLKSLGISQVDYAIVSHGDQDHISGLQYLLEENSDIRIKNLILPWLGREDPSYQSLVRLMESHGGQIHWMQAGERIKAGALSLTCLYHGSEHRKQERNEHSLVLELTYGQNAVLLTGDMSEAGEKDMLTQNALLTPAPPIQVLKSAHHGSEYSSSEPFLESVNPQWAIISCGEGNSYGHPHQETLDRYRNHGIKILITEDTGAITAHMNGETISWSIFLHQDMD